MRIGISIAPKHNRGVVMLYIGFNGYCKYCNGDHIVTKRWFQGMDRGVSTLH